MNRNTPESIRHSICTRLIVMAMSDCPHCWETPCVCADAYGYRHLSTEELTRLRNGIEALIVIKTKRGDKPDLRYVGTSAGKKK